MDDLARTNFSEDYNAKEIGREKINGKESAKLELTAKNKDVTYRKIHYWVEIGTGAPLKARFFGNY